MQRYVSRNLHVFIGFQTKQNKKNKIFVFNFFFAKTNDKLIGIFAKKKEKKSFG